MNSDIFLRGKKIALEAQSAMQAGLGGKNLERLILNMLERERQDISSKAPSSPSSSSSSMVNTSSPATSAVPSKTITPAKAVTATLTATNASSPATIDSGSSTPTTSSPLARSTTSSSACERFAMPLIDSATAPQSSPSAISPAATVAPSTTPPSTISPITASPKAATADAAATSISTATASSTTASSSLEASSSVGKKRRALPSFAMSPFLKTKLELKMPEKKCIKSEGSSSLKRKYPVVEPIEGYDAAITRMIDNMKKEKNVSSDLWSISSSSEDEDGESG
ncbi:hypothetical protein PS15m_007209 [Mucor circinelloides]